MIVSEKKRRGAMVYFYALTLPENCLKRNLLIMCPFQEIKTRNVLIVYEQLTQLISIN